MKINVNVYKDEKERYIASDPNDILRGKTFAYTKKTLEEINLPELKQISIDLYEKEGKQVPEPLLNFEGFNINYEN